MTTEGNELWYKSSYAKDLDSATQSKDSPVVEIEKRKAGKNGEHSKEEAERARIQARLRDVDDKLKAMDGRMSQAKIAYEEALVQHQRKIASEERKDADWIRNVLKGGVFSDRVAAMRLLVEEHPLYSLQYLTQLVTMVASKNRREGELAAKSLREMFTGALLLPSNRRLYSLAQRLAKHPMHSAANSRIPKMNLVHWYFEDQLKQLYGRFIDACAEGAKDTVVHYRELMMSNLFDLLRSKPEMERVLLQLMVNKLGDQDRSIASKSLTLLTKLVQVHSAMKDVVAREVELFLQRLGVSTRSQYYGVTFLNQIFFRQEADESLAARLLITYFRMFHTCLEIEAESNKESNKTKKNTPLRDVVALEGREHRLLGALLTGVRRAFPFAPKSFHGSDVFEEHLNALFRLVHVASFNKSVQVLSLLLLALDSREDLTDRFHRALYQRLLDPDVRSTSRHLMLLNIVFTSLRRDTNVTRACAILKRLLQQCLHSAPSFACGMLIVTSEILRVRPDVKILFVSPADPEKKAVIANYLESNKNFEIEKIAEHDIKMEYNGVKKSNGSRDGATKNEIKDESFEEFPSAPGIQPYARSPEFSGAVMDCAWELSELSKHYHPSVSKFAKQILALEVIDYNGDSMQDFSLNSFLQRFSYRNPKQKTVETDRKLHMRPMRAFWELEAPVTSDAFMEQKTYRPEEEFFVKYFTKKRQLEEASLKTHQRLLKQRKARSETDFGDADLESSDIDDVLEKDMMEMDDEEGSVDELEEAENTDADDFVEYDDEELNKMYPQDAVYEAHNQDDLSLEDSEMDINEDDKDEEEENEVEKNREKDRNEKIVKKEKNSMKNMDPMSNSKLSNTKKDSSSEEEEIDDDYDIDSEDFEESSDVDGQDWLKDDVEPSNKKSRRNIFVDASEFDELLQSSHKDENDEQRKWRKSREIKNIPKDNSRSNRFASRGSRKVHGQSQRFKRGNGRR